MCKVKRVNTKILIIPVNAKKKRVGFDLFIFFPGRLQVWNAHLKSRLIWLRHCLPLQWPLIRYNQRRANGWSRSTKHTLCFSESKLKSGASGMMKTLGVDVLDIYLDKELGRKDLQHFDCFRKKTYFQYYKVRCLEIVGNTTCFIWEDKKKKKKELP